MALFTATLMSPIGALHLLADEQHLLQLSFSPLKHPEEATLTPTPLIRQVAAEMEAYFKGTLRAFTTPVKFEDTVFRMRVWDELTRIPYGKTVSYQDLAVRLGNVKAIRAAGTANGHNPIAIIVPCHRVIGSRGQLVGYAGELWRKHWLLEHEARHAHGVHQLFE